MTAITKADLAGEDDWFEHQSIAIDPKQELMRIDKFLINRLEKISRNRVQNAIKAGAILVNSKETKANYKVRHGDVISIVLPRNPDIPTELIGEDIPLNIVYEDEHVLVINKQAGLVVHPGMGNYTGTLVNALRYYYDQKQLPILKNNPEDRPGLVHRIDKDTTGLMVIAKTEQAMTHLAKQFFDHSIDRTYVALVWGGFEENEGTIIGNIGRHPTDRMRMDVLDDGEGKHAVTHYKVLEDYYYVSIVQCKLETGRTHQIRVHMNHRLHPLFNDGRYGGDYIRKGTIYSKYKQFVDNCFELCPRQALHAQSLGFIHPESGEYLLFESSIPDDMSAVIAKWKAYFETKGGATE